MRETRDAPAVEVEDGALKARERSGGCCGGHGLQRSSEGGIEIDERWWPFGNKKERRRGGADRETMRSGFRSRAKRTDLERVERLRIEGLLIVGD